MRRPTVEQIAWSFALICGVAPLWATAWLPFVDLPQHLQLISALHRLDDASTLYPELLARRPELTPYLGYYYVVSALNWLMPLELANRLFLSAYVAGLPLSMAFLLRSLNRPSWPALLTLPFAYGDSLAWGFINYCTALPLGLLTCGFFVRSITASERSRKTWAVALAVSLVAVLLFHVQVFAYLAVALPFLLLSTSTADRFMRKAWWRARALALVGVVPGVVLFVLWVGLRVGQPQEIAPGQPWRSWGPMLSPQNLSFKPFAQNVGELISVAPQGPLAERLQFPILAGMFHDGRDQLAVRLVLLMAVASLLVFAATRRSERSTSARAAVAQAGAEQTGAEQSWPARLRMLGLVALALGLYFALPFDIRGYMYYLNTRFAHLVAALLVASVPVLSERAARVMTVLAASVALSIAIPYSRGFSAFDLESRPVAELARSAAPKARVMGLVHNFGSKVMTHPVYLHASCEVARSAGGITNFSFALTPHSPLMYRGTPPPTFASEWQPQQMSWELQGRFYDHFLIRGAHPRQLFPPGVVEQLNIVAQAGDFLLVTTNR